MTETPSYPWAVVRPAYSPGNPPDGPTGPVPPPGHTPSPGPEEGAPQESIDATSSDVEIQVTELVISRTVGVFEYVPDARNCSVMPLLETVVSPGTTWIES